MARSAGTTPSAEKVLDALFAFSIARPRLSASEVAEITGMNRSTAHRMLQLLESKHLVQRRLGDASQYEVTARVLQLSEVVLHQLDDLRSIALSHLTQLRDRTGETAALHVRQGGARVGVTQVESRHQLRLTYSDLGQRVPLYLGAPSLAMLAFLAGEQIERNLPSPDEEWPHIGVPDRGAMLAWLAKIRATGYAVSRAHRLAGIVSIAAPIFNRFDDVIASINVTGPEARFDPESIETMAKDVIEAASDLSRRMGHTAPPTSSPSTQGVGNTHHARDHINSRRSDIDEE
jgi:DNA-binding IclR family transcriptional regulator